MRTPRELAVNTLESVFQGRVFIADALEQTFAGSRKTEEVSAASRKETVFLVRGTAERFVFLESILKRLVSGTYDKLPFPVRCVLLTGLFEILFSRTPEYALVNESVRLTEQLRFSSHKGLVNAVLRRAVREKDHLTGGLTLAERISFAPYPFQVLSSQYGEERVLKMGEFFLSGESKKLSVRLNASKTDAASFVRRLSETGISATETGIIPDTLYLDGYASIEEIPGYGDGLFYVEAPAMAASVFAVREEILSASGPIRILDACASPGGKTVAFADLLALRRKKRGTFDHIVASDVSVNKTEKLRENVARYGFSDFVTVKTADATLERDDENDSYDFINLDVPCSGLGVLSGKPEAKKTFNEKTLNSLVEIQQKILSANAGKLKSGGTLVYSTCTLTAEENGNQIRRFLETQQEYALTGEKQFIPGEDATDGFYYAVMKKIR